jgi:hypothetical protein
MKKKQAQAIWRPEEASQPLPGFFFRNEKETSAGHLEARGSLAAFACFFFRNEKETSAGHLEARVIVLFINFFYRLYFRILHLLSLLLLLK